MSKMLWIMGLRTDQIDSDKYIIFDYGALDFWIPERWVWYLRGSVEYRLSEHYVGRKYPEFNLKIYWQREGKE